MWQRYCYSEQPADYLAGVARALLYAAVTRALVEADAERDQFHTKYDNMVVLESSIQGKSKTMFWQALAGTHPSGHEYCVEAPHSHKIEDFNRAGSNAWILTLDELAQFKPGEVRNLKSWLSAIWDTWIPKYREHSQTRLRRFVVVGTTNEEEYLTDPTGNRRHHPIRCGATIDIEALLRDRGQLWAEAVALYRQKLDKWWVVPGAEDAQEGRAAELPYEQEIVAGIARFDPLPTVQIETKRGKTKRVVFVSKTMVHAWLGGSENRDHNKLIRAGQAMRKLGWVKNDQTRLRRSAFVVKDLPDNACGDPSTMRSGRIWPGAIPERDQYYLQLKDLGDE